MAEHRERLPEHRERLAEYTESVREHGKRLPEHTEPPRRVFWVPFCGSARSMLGLHVATWERDGILIPVYSGGIIIIVVLVTRYSSQRYRCSLSEFLNLPQDCSHLRSLRGSKAFLGLIL